MVSQEDFTIVKCDSCGFLITSPRPADDQLGRYYESEDYISHSNTKKSLFSRAYQLVRNKAVRDKRKWVEAHSRKGQILDMGCGTGHFLNECKLNGWDITGVEVSEVARANAFTEHGIKPLSSFDEVKEDSNQFNAISMWHVLEHLPNLNEHLNKFHKILKDDGALFIAVPNHESLDAVHYGPQWAAWDVPIHLWHFSKSSMKNLAEKNGFEITEIKNMAFDSFYVSLLSEKYKNGSMRPIHAFLTGLRSNLAGRSSKNMSSLVYVLKKAV
ncbi:MAG: methyltransferase domain-containing protein [Flavobacteriia bacterium]|nr:methyltransferase domain-containing protein [Flavobacteriia bacterium]